MGILLEVPETRDIFENPRGEIGRRGWWSAIFMYATPDLFRAVREKHPLTIEAVENIVSRTEFEFFDKDDEDYKFGSSCSPKLHYWTWNIIIQANPEEEPEHLYHEIGHAYYRPWGKDHKNPGGEEDQLDKEAIRFWRENEAYTCDLIKRLKE